MKSYLIFAIVLTVVYLVYYAVIIVQDLYGKKGTGKKEEEVFDLGEMVEEESVDVTESETGFSVGSEAYETEITPTATFAQEDTSADGEAAMAERLERIKAKAEERMEESTPYLSDARTADEMYKTMICRGKLDSRPDMEWKPLKDRL